MSYFRMGVVLFGIIDYCLIFDLFMYGQKGGLLCEFCR